MHKKASLNLSINAIVILILAITMLGLGLSFMRNIFGTATQEFQEVTGTIHKQMIDQMKEGNKEIDLSSLVYDIKPGEKKQIYIGFKNTDNEEKKFIIKGIKFSSMPADLDCGLYEDDDVMLEYKHKATTVQGGETLVLPMNIKVDSSANTGTCFYEVLIDEEDDSLVGYWNFEKEDDATDISGNENNGILGEGLNKPAWNNSGIIGSALDFYSTDYVELVESNVLIPNPDVWSISTWFNADSIGSANTANRILTVHRGSGAGTGVSLTLGENNRALLFYRDGGGASFFIMIDTVSTGTWYHYAVTYDGVTYNPYLNGELKNATTNSITTMGTYEVIIGNFDKGGSTYDFNGRIDEVKIYNKTLSPSEIQKLYTGYDSSIQLTVNVE